MKINNFDKINIKNIILNKVKTKDDKKIIDIKYKNNESKKKDVCIFKISNVHLVSNILYNNLRKHYIEILISNIDFYNFILELEIHMKKLLLDKSDKILTNFNDIDENTIDELFKTNIKLSKYYNNPIFKFNIIRNTRNNNTLIYDRNKKTVLDENLQQNQDISLIINLDKVLITNYNIELLFQIEQIKINKNDINDNIKRNLNEYYFDSNDEENDEENNEENDEGNNEENEEESNEKNDDKNNKEKINNEEKEINEKNNKD
jgi:hypothetical protein